MKKLLPLTALIVVAIAASYLLVFRDSDSSSSVQQSDMIAPVQNSESEIQTQDNAGSEEFTASQVAQHKTADDCWTIINDKVYNLTSYVPRHPGGDEILRACGTDGTSLFETRKTADGQTIGAGGSHSSSAEDALNKLQIGLLKD